MDAEESCMMRDVIRLKVSDPDRFSTLCKMHLSFNMNLGNEHFSSILDDKPRNKKSGFTPFSKRQRTRRRTVTGVMDGAPLTQEGICQVYQLIEYLGRDFNISQEGLFRKSGKLSRQQELKEMLNFGAAVDLDLGQYSVHECASVLKSFLADLPEPLLTEAHYPAHCQIPDLCADDMTDEQKSLARIKQIKSLQLLFLLLPSNNRRLQQDVLTLLNRVTQGQRDNLMDSHNLATMFAPHIMCPRKMKGEELQTASVNITRAVAFMIENVAELFKVPVELSQDVQAYWNEKASEEKKQSNINFLTLKAKFGLNDVIGTNGVTVKTKISFCDRTMANDPENKDTTTVALAGLYAYVQSMPDCPRKRKLIKQFNKENGYGVNLGIPVPSSKENKHKRSKSVGDPIKKNEMDEQKSEFLAPFKDNVKTVDKENLSKKRKRKVGSESCPNDAEENNARVRLSKIDHQQSGPIISKYSSPLARTVLRASRRVKKAVMSQKNRGTTVVLKSTRSQTD